MTDDELEERLKNWGRWTMEKKGYRYVCSDEPEAKRQGPKAFINVNDALLVMRAWQKMPTSQYDLRRARLLIGVFYCFAGNINQKLRYIRRIYHYRIMLREVRPLMRTAKGFMRNLILIEDLRESHRYK